MRGLTTLSDGKDRAAWLEARRHVITATQAAAIAGSHPYAKVLDVWNERTDPDYDPSLYRNRWLDERADLGVSREPAIVEWAGEEVGLAFIPNVALLADPERPGFAATPDGHAIVRTLRDVAEFWSDQGMEKPAKGDRVLVECKTTQQRWDQKGLPQHVLDQCIWQGMVIGARWVVVAAEFYTWKGKGNDRHPELVGTWLRLIDVTQHHKRLDFLLGKVAQFQEWEAEGIAPESDLDLAALEAPGFDATPEEVAEYADLERVRDALERIADIQDELDEMAELTAELKTLQAEVSKIAKAYEGRRVHFQGGRFTAKLVRYTREVKDTDKLDPATLRDITNWTETERMTYERNTQ